MYTKKLMFKKTFDLAVSLIFVVEFEIKFTF